jgi:hypothetical protein
MIYFYLFFYKYLDKILSRPEIGYTKKPYFFSTEKAGL